MSQKNKAPKEHEGIIMVTRKGIGFVDISEGESILIRQGDTLTALSGDTVRVAPAGFERGTRAGKVTEILHRGQEKFVGRVIEEDGKPRFFADHRKMYTPFVITSDTPEKDQKVVFHFTGWNESENLPEGEIEEVLGKVGDHEVEMRALLLREGFAADFPQPVKEEAEVLEETGDQLLKDGMEGRKDFRGTTTFTIDPLTAKDFDDAISVKELGDGKYEIGIHIADVSYFVKEGSTIDKEARHRATSVYLVDRTIPMLPHVLSENLCSLRPNEDRLAMSAVFTLDEQGGVLDEWYGETIIHSDRRFTYEEAQEVLDNQEGEFLTELNILKRFSDIIRERRTKNGAVTIDRSEVKVEVDEKGVPTRVYLKESIDTNKLIEDFMLLANENVSKYMSKVAKESKTPRPFIYRIHDSPDEEKIEALKEFAEALGHDLDFDPQQGVTGKDFNDLFQQVEGTPEEYLIKTTAIRSLSKAIYTTRNIGHFGLAFNFYSHFTSPIRRYPDLIIHRLMKKWIAKEELTKPEVARIEEDAIHSTEREISASAAERDSIKLKQVEYMANHVGEEFDAVITGVTNRGIFVEEVTTRSDGFVSIRDLGDDYYQFDEPNYQLVGQNKGKTYQLGDEVRVRLTNTNPIDRQLDFVLAKEKEAAS